MKLLNENCENIISTLDWSNIVIVTDPPFNINYHYHSYKDSMKEENYYEMLYRIFHNSAFVVIQYPEAIHKITLKMGIAPTRVISWVYNSNTPRQHRDIAFYGITPDLTKGSQPYKNPTDKRILKRIQEGKSAKLYDWWNVNQVKNVSTEKTIHPCQMPLKIMENIITILPSHLTIFDPFMGVGTTGVACKMLNRNFIGCEIDAEYFSIAKKRIEDI